MAEAVTVRKVLVDGQEYELKQVGKESVGAIKAHIRKLRRSPLEVAKESLAIFSPDEQKILLTEALRAAVNTSVSLDEIQDFMASDDGIAFLVWLSLKDQKKDFTLAAAYDVMMDQKMTLVEPVVVAEIASAVN